MAARPVGPESTLIASLPSRIGRENGHQVVRNRSSFSPTLPAPHSIRATSSKDSRGPRGRLPDGSP